MTTYRRTPLARLQPGDEAYEKTRKGMRLLGVVESAVKNTERRSVTVRFQGQPGGFSQNWAASLYVRSTKGTP